MVITVTRRCRPIRLGFLVRPGQKEDLRRAIEINTVLWGGIYNPLIPWYGCIPPIWKEGKLAAPSAKDVLRGYVATFRPDYIVKPDDSEDVKDGLFPSERIISHGDVLSVPGEQEYTASRSPVRFGVDIADVYTQAYQQIFQFVRRHPQKAIIPKAAGRISLLGACLWGSFPTVEDLPKYEDTFCRAFQAETTTCRALSTLEHEALTPLQITRHALKASTRRPDPCVFILQSTNALDIIDFWNLRACGGACIPLPIDPTEHVAREVRTFMELHLRKWAANDTKLAYPLLVPSRSLRQDGVRKAIQALDLDREHFSHIGRYPRLWKEQEVHWDMCHPVSFYHSEQTDRITTDGERLVFGAVRPDFASEFGRYGPRWVNIISTGDEQRNGLPVNVIPDHISDVGQLVGALSLEKLWISSDGIAVCCNGWESQHYWVIPKAEQIGRQWASEHGYEFALSDAGHLLESMVSTAGGLWQGRWFASAEIVKKFGKMGRGTPIGAQSLRRVLQQTYQDHEIFGFDKKSLDYFQDRSILHIGLRIQCPHCRQHPWYPIEQLHNNLKCTSCTAEFPFPICGPPAQGWSYKSLGPFASPNFAQGSYSVFLTLRFLVDQLRANTTCVPSCILKKTGHGEMEVDFICFWNRPSWKDKSQHLILGECKCFGDFKKKDVQTMRELARSFPNAIMAFCTLKDGLSSEERKLLGTFAKSGRKPTDNGKWPTPLLILTGNELCVPTPALFPSDKIWGEFSQRIPGADWSIYDLCDASQQLYLGLPSWQDSLSEHYRKKYTRTPSSGDSG